MSSRMHGSEEALATLACRRVRTLAEPCVLVGGLGLGFTLRATLDLLPPDATVVVAELVPRSRRLEPRPARPARRASAGGPARQDRGRRRRRHAARQPQPLRRRAARRGQRAGGDDRVRQRRALRRSRPGGRPRGAEGRRGPGRLVGVGASQVRAAPALRQVHRRSRARPRPIEKGRSAPHHLSRPQAERNGSERRRVSAVLAPSSGAGSVAAPSQGRRCRSGPADGACCGRGGRGRSCASRPSPATSGDGRSAPG